MTPTIRFERLAGHDRKAFSCGEEALDRYFQTLVTQDVRRRVTNCFVAVMEAGEIAGFYTFASATIPVIELGDEARRLPRYPAVPATLIGRLAVDRRFQGQRLGGAMILDAVERAARADAMNYALLVDAKGERAAGFYQHLGFRCFASRPLSLFLPLQTALRAMAENA